MTYVGNELSYTRCWGEWELGYRVPVANEGWITPEESATCEAYFAELYSLNETMAHNEKLARLHDKRWLASRDQNDIANAKALRAMNHGTFLRKSEIVAALDEIGRRAQLRKIDAEIAAML